MIYIISLICLLLPTYLIRFSIFGIPTTLLEILIYFAAILTLILKIKDKKSKTQTKNLKTIFPNSYFLIPVILFIFAGIISVIFSPDKKEALGLFKAYIFDPILFFFIIIINLNGKKVIPNPKQKLEIIFKALILSGALVAAQAIWQKISGNVTLDGRVVGIFGYSPNYLALYLVPISILSFGLIWQKKNKIPYIILFFTIIIGIILTGSRIAMTAVPVAISAFFIIYYWREIRIRKILVMLLYCYIALLLVGGWWLAKPDWQASASAGRISSSNNIRWEIWSTTIKDIIPENNNWLWGVGLGNYQNYFTDLTKNRVNFPEWISPMALTPHNLFLTVWVNLGLLGLVAFVWLLVLFFKNNKGNLYSIILCSAMIAIIVQGLVDTPYWKNDLAVIFWILLALKYNFDKIIIPRRI